MALDPGLHSVLSGSRRDPLFLTLGLVLEPELFSLVLPVARADGEQLFCARSNFRFWAVEYLHGGGRNREHSKAAGS